MSKENVEIVKAAIEAWKQGPRSASRRATSVAMEVSRPAALKDRR
jgi:hypothetical protein